MSELKVNTINPSSGTSLQFPVATQVVVGNTGNSTVLVVSSATAENLGALNGDYHLYTTDGIVKSVYGWKSNSVSEALGTVSAHPLNLITNNTARMTISGGGAGDITLNNSQLILDKTSAGNNVAVTGINFVTNPQWSSWTRGIQWSLGNAATADGAGIGAFGVNGLTANRISIGFNPSPWNETANSLHVTQDGSVGIGVASPASKLHVKGQANAGLLRLETTDAIASAGACYLGLWGSAGRGGYLGFGGSNNTLDIWNDLGGPTRFGTSNTERMRIDSSGNVGIGDTSPTVKVDLGNYFINNTSPTGAEQTSHIRLYKSGENRYGFGISTNALNIAANQSTGTIRLYTNSLERMRIDSDGNVGVGTSTPGATFDVAGTGKFSGLLTLAGATSSALISCETAPTQGQHLANKTYVDSINYLKAGAVTVTTPPEGSANNYTIDVTGLVPGKLYIYAARVSVAGAGAGNTSTFTAETASGEICGLGTLTVQHSSVAANIATAYPPIQSISNGANISGGGTVNSTNNTRIYAWHYVSVIRYA